MELYLKGTVSRDSGTFLTSTLDHRLLYVLAIFVLKLMSLR
jgi:hypothetical protein